MSLHLQADEIVSIEELPFNDTVYNFQVEDDESYVANGLVVHNCRCLYVAILKDETDKPPISKIPKEIEDSFNGINDFR